MIPIDEAARQQGEADLRALSEQLQNLVCLLLEQVPAQLDDGTRVPWAVVPHIVIDGLAGVIHAVVQGLVLRGGVTAHAGPLRQVASLEARIRALVVEAGATARPS